MWLKGIVFCPDKNFPKFDSSQFFLPIQPWLSSTGLSLHNSHVWAVLGIWRLPDIKQRWPIWLEASLWMLIHCWGFDVQKRWIEMRKYSWQFYWNCKLCFVQESSCILLETSHELCNSWCKKYLYLLDSHDCWQVCFFRCARFIATHSIWQRLFY